MTAGSDGSTLTYDYHVHSTYSDGSDVEAMLDAAQEVDLDGVGFADHCNVSAREPGASRSFDLDETYPERRREIQSLREAYDLRIFDAVEMDYRPADEDRIEAFLGDADFDYTIGSVHHVGRGNVVAPGEHAGETDESRRAFVADYFDLVVELVESDLFDVVAHVDLPERTEVLRGFATEEQYRDVAVALAESRTVPEVNAGRVFGDFGAVHPHPEFLDVLQREGVRFVTSTDAHAPPELPARAEYLAAVVRERDLDLVALD